MHKSVSLFFCLFIGIAIGQESPDNYINSDPADFFNNLSYDSITHLPLGFIYGVEHGVRHLVGLNLSAAFIKICLFPSHIFPPYKGLLNGIPYKFIISIIIAEEVMVHLILLPLFSYTAEIALSNTDTFYSKSIIESGSKLLTCSVFGLAHMLNPQPSFVQAILAGVYCLVSFGLYEKHGFIATLSSHLTFDLIPLYILKTHFHHRNAVVN